MSKCTNLACEFIFSSNDCFCFFTHALQCFSLISENRLFYLIFELISSRWRYWLYHRGRWELSMCYQPPALSLVTLVYFSAVEKSKAGSNTTPVVSHCLKKWLNDKMKWLYPEKLKKKNTFEYSSELFYKAVAFFSWIMQQKLFWGFISTLFTKIYKA